jgi:EmrB/QacA subfamily drug resistance transporter
MSTAIVAASPPSSMPLPRRRVLVIIGALMLGMFLAALDQTIVSTALPTIAGDLHGASHYTWVVTAYLLASTVTTPLWGKLGDQFGRKKFFQAAIVIFLIGSALSGLSRSMLELIVFRAVQGLGGGGLMVGAQTIVGDVVSPRERGRYMGFFSAMFGVTTIVGPLIGGLFVDTVGWRWIFYVNIPIGVAALVVTGVALPGTLTRVHRTIDYLGFAFLAVAASGLVLFTSLGGTSFGWTSPFIVAMGVAGVVFTVLFVVAELRAAEPVIPMGLFKNRVFTSSSAIGFVVGFAMFGGMTFMPLYLQIVKNVSPTASGLRLFPMMAGFLVASIGAGQLITRLGRYKVFPLVGSAFMTVGLYLLSTIGVTTGAWELSGYMLIFGLGMGMVMPVLVVAVQNSVSYENLGTATSSSVFFRMIGGSFGTAVFGAIYANIVVTNVLHALHLSSAPPHFSFGTTNSQSLSALPPAVHAGVVEGIAHTISTVFLIGVPISFVAFLLSWWLPEIPLRKSVRTVESGERVPEGQTSLHELQRAVERVASRENRAEVYRSLAQRAGLELEPRSCWLLYRLADRPGSTASEVAAGLKVDPDRIAEGLRELVDGGYVAQGTEHAVVVLTERGTDAIDRLAEARRARMTELLEGWDPEAHPEVVDMVRRLARELLADDERLLADARSVTPVG